jgi:hypothetical protein
MRPARCILAVLAIAAIVAGPAQSAIREVALDPPVRAYVRDGCPFTRM